MEADAGVLAALKDLSKLQAEFLNLEVANTRRFEYALKPLYAKRQELLDTIESFWPIVFEAEPAERFLTPLDLDILSSLKSFKVDRYQIEREDLGEPRSLRFTFVFSPNQYLEDTTLIKELEYKSGPGLSGGFVSRPVPIRWKSKTTDPTRGLLNAAVELYQAEQTLNSEGGEVDAVERESLWQHEKLRELLNQEDEADRDISFFCWFGFRGVVLQRGADADDALNEDNGGSDDGFEAILDVEILPSGEEVSISLAEDLWPTAPVSYMAALKQQEDNEDESDGEIRKSTEESDNDVPELVPASEMERPSKKRRVEGQS